VKPWLIRMRWLIHSCDMTCSCVWHASLISLAKCRDCDAMTYSYAMTHSYMWHGSVTWRIRICDMPHWYVDMIHRYIWHDSWKYLTESRDCKAMTHLCAMTPWYVDMTHSHIPQNSSICVAVTRWHVFCWYVLQYLETVKPMHDRYVEPSKQHADIIIPFVGRNVAAVQVSLSLLHARTP